MITSCRVLPGPPIHKHLYLEISDRRQRVGAVYEPRVLKRNVTAIVEYLPGGEAVKIVGEGQQYATLAPAQT